LNTKEARSHLERANASLSIAVENALEMKAAASEIPASLERVAASLNKVAAGVSQAEITVLAPQLRMLDARMRHLQTLLDAAAAFYCASLSKAREGSGCYDAFGHATVPSNAHQLHMEA
jgi:hypothetical protein